MTVYHKYPEKIQVIVARMKMGIGAKCPICSRGIAYDKIAYAYYCPANGNDDSHFFIDCEDYVDGVGVVTGSNLPKEGVDAPARALWEHYVIGEIE